jgi:hypothetical protein
MFYRRRAVVALFASASIALLSLAFAQPSHADQTLGPYVIQNTASRLCVQLNAADQGPDIQLVQDSCANADGSTRTDAQWMFVPIGGGLYHVVNRATGNCMRALRDADFSQVQTIDCTGISDLKWDFRAAPSGGHLELVSHVSNGSRCLDVLENSFAPTTMDIFHCTSTSSNTNTAQTFYIQPNPVPISTPPQ